MWRSHGRQASLMGKAASMESFHWKHTLQEQRIKALEKKSKWQIRDHLVGQPATCPNVMALVKVLPSSISALTMGPWHLTSAVEHFATCRHSSWTELWHSLTTQMTRNHTIATLSMHLKHPLVESIALSLFMNSETAATTPWERLQNFQRALNQWRDG